MPSIVAFNQQSRLGKTGAFVRNRQLVDLRPVGAILCQGSGLQANLPDLLKDANVPTNALRINRLGLVPMANKRQAFG